MPGAEKLARCPKGEYRDKKTKLCVKKTKKVSPKKSPPKSVTPKKKNSLSRSSSTSVSFVIRRTPSPSPSPNSPSKKEIPLLSKMDDLDDWDKTYMKSLLHALQNTSSLFKIESILNKEIENLEKNGKTGKFTFTSKDVKRIVPHLKHYLAYFKRIAKENKTSYIKLDVILALHK
jgi:hypothetical protein